MKLTNYKTNDGICYQRKILWLESKILCRNSDFRRWL